MGGLIVAVLLACMMAMPGLAAADVTVDKRTMAAGSQHALTFSVPDDYDGKGAVLTYVEFHIPEGFSLLECIPLEVWGCSADRARRMATFQRTGSEARNDGDDNELGVRVRAAPTAGRYAVVVKQWYKSGHVVVWDGPPGSERPALVVDVTGSSPAGPVDAFEETSDTTPEVRTLASPRIRKPSWPPLRTVVAIVLAASVPFALWWRRRSLPAKGP